MKKLILLTITLILFAGCRGKYKTEDNPKKEWSHEIISNLEADTTLSVYIVSEHAYINVNKKFYKARLVSGTDLVSIPIGFLLIFFSLFFIIGVLITIGFMDD